MKWKAVSLKNEQKLGEMCTQCTIKRADVTINYSTSLDTVKDFLIKLRMKPCMHLVEKGIH